MIQRGSNILQLHRKPTAFLVTTIRIGVKLAEQGVNKEVGCGLFHGEVNHGTLGVDITPRKLHPVLRAERAEMDRFATGQKNYFFGCLMNVILDVVE